MKEIPAVTMSEEAGQAGRRGLLQGAPGSSKEAGRRGPRTVGAGGKQGEPVAPAALVMKPIMASSQVLSADATTFL